jgi:hypothetical protein
MPSPLVLMPYLCVAILAAGLAGLLMIAALASVRWPAVGWRLYGVYACGTLPLALLLGILIANFTAADPVAPTGLIFVDFALNSVWYAAYPVLVAILLARRLQRHSLRL